MTKGANREAALGGCPKGAGLGRLLEPAAQAVTTATPSCQEGRAGSAWKQWACRGTGEGRIAGSECDTFTHWAPHTGSPWTQLMTLAAVTAKQAKGRKGLPVPFTRLPARHQGSQGQASLSAPPALRCAGHGVRLCPWAWGGKDLTGLEEGEGLGALGLVSDPVLPLPTWAHMYCLSEMPVPLASSCSPISFSNPHNLLTHESPKPLVPLKTDLPIYLHPPTPNPISGPPSMNPVSHSHPAPFHLLFFFLRERGRKGKGGRKDGGLGRKRERDIDCLPPIRAQTRD